MLYNHNIYIKRQSPPTTSAISLEEAKLFLNIDNDGQDKLILNLIEMATEYAEWYIEKSLRPQKWQLLCDGYLPNKLALNFGPINSIESVTINVNGKESIMNSSEYKLEKTSNYLKINNLVGIGQMVVIYDTGYENNKEIPAPIREGILHHIATVYNNRGNADTISSVKQIYSLYRNFKLAL